LINRILIIGASGSGTSTLGEALSRRLHFNFFESDDYFWMPPKYSFSQKRNREESQKLLMNDLSNNDSWVLSGSLCGWGDIFMPMFELVVYLWVERDIRIQRLMKRECDRYGEEIRPKGNRYEQFLEFIRWASIYDEAGLDMRSKITHKEWMKRLNCPSIRIEGDLSTDERVKIIMDKLNEFKL
jgi:adenylate kinase family enzyme